jgi:DNA-binding beta-propeller fold protein YncE
MRDLKKIPLAGWCFLLLLAACKPDPQPEPVEVAYENGILLANEGNFQGGNASLSFVSRENDTVVPDVFQAEIGRPLGDVAQSITVVGSRAYIVVNNSGKIEAVELPAFSSVCALTGMQSPRYLLPLPSGRALVSDLYSKTIHVVDLAGCTVIGHIATSGWTEEMHLVGNRAFVTQTGTDKLLIIDTQALTLTDSLFVGREPNSLVQDAQGKLWVLCGSALGQAQPHLVRVNVDSLAVEATFAFPSTQNAPSKLCINPAGDRLYFIDGGIFAMGIADGSLPAQPWIPKGNHNWYGLDIDPQTGLLYATDALDFQHQGMLYRFSPSSATPLASFQVGMIPGEMVFLP